MAGFSAATLISTNSLNDNEDYEYVKFEVKIIF